MERVAIHAQRQAHTECVATPTQGKARVEHELHLHKTKALWNIHLYPSESKAGMRHRPVPLTEASTCTTCMDVYGRHAVCHPFFSTHHTQHGHSQPDPRVRAKPTPLAGCSDTATQTHPSRAVLCSVLMETHIPIINEYGCLPKVFNC